MDNEPIRANVGGIYGRDRGLARKPRKKLRILMWVAALSLVGGLALGLLSALEHVQESAARAR